MQLSFTKMHGLGNDFMVLKGTEPPASGVISALADRRTGIGFDQLLWLEDARDTNTDIFYRTFNADGSESEQCGNGARCIARYVANEITSGNNEFRLGYSGGVVDARIEADDNVAVSLGEPNYSLASLPFDLEQASDRNGDVYSLNANGENVDVELVSIGNPHAVILVDSVATARVQELGASLEQHAGFPNRANIGFMQIESQDRIKLRVYERGVGETLACGTGACAAVAVGCRAEKLATDVAVELPGGILRVKWEGVGESMWLVGEAVTAFKGTIAI